MTEPGSAHVEGEPDVEAEGSPTDAVPDESNLVSDDSSDAHEAATELSSIRIQDGQESGHARRERTISRGHAGAPVENAPSAAPLSPAPPRSSKPAAMPSGAPAGTSSTSPNNAARGVVRGLKMVLATVVLVVVGVGLGLILYFTPAMAARNIVVAGTGTVTREEVLDAAQVRPGTPLLQINTNQVADRIAAIRRVASARVQRQYPSALRITIVERIAVVVKDFPDGPHLFDRDGVDFATDPPPPALPYIEVENPGPTDPATMAALKVLTALRPEVAGQVGRIAAPSVSSITLTLSDGRVVIWGTTDRADEKAEKLAALLTQPGRTYDVSSPDLPTVK